MKSLDIGLAHVIDSDKHICRLRKDLTCHKLYTELACIKKLKAFSQIHIFSVWDFMSLLKALRNRFSHQGDIWLPMANAEVLRLINEIFVDEESDIDSHGNTLSHFVMYRKAMMNLGGNTQAIDSFIATLKSGLTIEQALENPMIPAAAKAYVEASFKIINTAKDHELAAAFAFGRESMIPDMFRSILANLKNHPEAQYIIEYFDKHVEIDDGKHKHLAYDMVDTLCNKDPKKIDEVLEMVRSYLQSRLDFNNAIYDSIVN